ILKVATRSGTSWKVETVDKASGPLGLPTSAPADVTATRVGSGGQPIVAFGDGGRTMVAVKSGASWKAQAVTGPGGLAVSLALDKSGNPRVAYYDVSGGGHLASAPGGANSQGSHLAAGGSGA